MAELLAATPHATHPVLRSGAQKAPSWGRASTRALDAEHGADEASGTARRPSPGGPGEPPPQGAPPRGPGTEVFPPALTPSRRPAPRNALPSTPRAAFLPLTATTRLRAPRTPALPEGGPLSSLPVPGHRGRTCPFPGPDTGPSHLTRAGGGPHLQRSRCAPCPKLLGRTKLPGSDDPASLRACWPPVP